MAINDKLNRIKEIKEDIKQALIDKGVEVTDEDSFASYADKITNIPMEGGDPYYEDLYNMRTSNGTNMVGLFARTKGDSLDLTGLDTSQCTNMSYMFEWCAFKNIDITGWDTSNVTDMSYMLSYCSSNINCSGINTDNVTNVQNMFNACTISDNTWVSNLRFPKVTSFSNLFNSVKVDSIDLSGWDISNITNMSNVFESAQVKKIDLSNWKTDKVTDMSYMFNAYASYIEELIIPDWDMTNVTSKSNFFPSSSSYTKNLRYIDLSRSNEYTINLFATTYLPTRTETTYGDIAIPADSSQEVIDALIAKYWRPIGPSFNVESFQITSELDEVRPGQKTKVVYHSQVPWYSTISEVEFISSDDSIATVNENGEVTAVSLGSVEIYARLKDNPEAVSNTISINVTESDSTPYVIKFKSNLKSPTNSHTVCINNVYVAMTKMDYNPYTKVYTYDAGKPITNAIFVSNLYYNTQITELLKFDFNSNNITDMSHMFEYCKELDFTPISTWDVSKVTNMQYIFTNCSMTTIDLNNWDVSSVTDMMCLFNECKSLKYVDLSNWKAENVIQLGIMFKDCTSLEFLDLSGWVINKIRGSYNTFYNVPSTCKIYVGPNWTLTESECSFTGTFIRVNPEYYTEYSIDSSTATFNMRSIDSINSGAYLPELSNGYDAVLLTLNDGSITTDLNTEANQVSSIKIYYPEETSYVKFANTKVKEVNHLSGSNITDCTGMFTNCVYLEKADLTSLDSTKVTVDTTMFEGVNTEAEVTFNDSWDIPNEDMGRGNPYYVEYTLHVKDGSTDALNNKNGLYLPQITDCMGGTLDYSELITIHLKDGTTTNDMGTLVTDIDRVVIEYPEGTGAVKFKSSNAWVYKNIKEILYINVDNIVDMSSMFFNCGFLESINGIEYWNTTGISDMSLMFHYCSALTPLDLSKWNVSSVTSMEGMFSGVSADCQIYVGPNWTLTEEETGFKGTFTRV